MSRPDTSNGENDPEKGQRIAKVMARAGLCSRREAERWITDGRVTVDGSKIDSPALTVTSATKITVDGKPLPIAQPTRMWRFHKIRGLLTSRGDPEGRATVYSILPKTLANAITIGRLDMNSEGLLLLTNNGELARHIELPTTAWSRRYRVRVHGRINDEQLKALKRGVTVDGVNYGSIQASLERQVNANAWLSVTLQEGKNREIRKVFEHLGYTVSRLIRVSFGPFQLGNLKAGAVEEVRARVLKDQLPQYVKSSK